MKQTIYKQKEIRIEGIFEALKIALLSGMEEGGVTSGDYTICEHIEKFRLGL